MRLFGEYLHDERDNQTAQSVYPWVTTDMFVATPRTNLPYSFTQDRVKLGGDYRISPQAKLAAGLDYDARERTFQSAEKTDETSGWAKGHWKALENLDLSLKLETGERRNSGYQAVPGIIPPDNPLMRKYNPRSEVLPRQARRGTALRRRGRARMREVRRAAESSRASEPPRRGDDTCAQRPRHGHVMRR